MEIRYYGFQNHNPGNHNILTFDRIPKDAKILGAEKDQTNFIRIAILVDPKNTVEDKNFLYVEDWVPIEIEMHRLKLVERFQVFGRQVPRGKKTYRYLFEII